MLETIRAFCAERLAESGEQEAIRDAHAGYYLDLMMEADPRLRTAEQMEWLARLDEESADLDAAVRWSTETGRLELALRLMAHGACYWWMRGHRRTSADLALGLLAALGETRFPGREEEYVMCVLITAWSGARNETLRARLDEARRLLPITHLPMRVEFLMMLLSMFTGPPEDFETIYRLLEEGRTEPLPPWQEALSFSGQAFVLQVLGRTDESLARFERSLAAFKALGERWGTVLVVSGLGALRQAQGDYRAAYALADEALSTALELDANTEIAESLCRRADALVHLDDPGRAWDDYVRAAELSRRNGSMETLAWAWLGQGEVALARGDLDRARTLLLQAREVCPDGWFSTEDTRERIAAGLAAISRAVSER